MFKIFVALLFIYLCNKSSKFPFQEIGSGAHFNHSIWDTEGKKNLFWDPSKSDKVSDFARHWIAGLVKNTYAMTAILCPTVQLLSKNAWRMGSFRSVLFK